MYNGARCEKGPMTGVTASKVKMMTAIMLEKRITGHRRPFNGPSEIQTQVKEYTAVKALPSVGYSFYQMELAYSFITNHHQAMRENLRFEPPCKLPAGPSCYVP